MLLQGYNLEVKQQSNNSISSVVVECTVYNVVAGLQPGGEAAEQQPFQSVVVVVVVECTVYNNVAGLQSGSVVVVVEFI